MGGKEVMVREQPDVDDGPFTPRIKTAVENCSSDQQTCKSSLQE